MVKKLIVLLILLAVLGGGVLTYFLLRPTEESIIRGRFRDLSAEISKNGKEGGIKAVVTSQAVGRYFAEKTSVDVDGLSWLNGDYSPELITANVFRARQMFQTLSLDFEDITMTRNGDSATVLFSVTLTGIHRNGDRIRELRELEATLKKIDGKWLFSGFRIQKIIKQ